MRQGVEEMDKHFQKRVEDFRNTMEFGKEQKNMDLLHEYFKTSASGNLIWLAWFFDNDEYASERLNNPDIR